MEGAEADAFRASAELLALESMGAVRLRALHPPALTDPAGIDAVADLFDDAGVVAV